MWPGASLVFGILFTLAGFWYVACSIKPSLRKYARRRPRGGSGPASRLFCLAFAIFLLDGGLGFIAKSFGWSVVAQLSLALTLPAVVTVLVVSIIDWLRNRD
jgi:hypothetical protein